MPSGRALPRVETLRAHPGSTKGRDPEQITAPGRIPCKDTDLSLSSENHSTSARNQVERVTSAPVESVAYMDTVSTRETFTSSRLRTRY